MKCRYKICGESKSLPLNENIWTFETDGNGPAEVTKMSGTMLSWGSSLDMAQFFGKFWTSQSVTQNSLFV